VGGTFNMTGPCAAHDCPRSGKIINISSAAGDKGGRGQTNYAASKGPSTLSPGPWRWNSRLGESP